MRAQPIVKVGQIWADNDPRAHGRQVRVVAIDGTHATVELVATRRSPRSTAQQTTAQPGRRSRISLGRFRPTSTDYRLATDGGA